ncbi:hypothetical protein ABK040_006853 [Willaertia magna]
MSDKLTLRGNKKRSVSVSTTAYANDSLHSSVNSFSDFSDLSNDKSSLTSLSSNSPNFPSNVSTYKVVVIGDTEVGKTQFINRYITNSFTRDYTPTIIESYTTSVHSYDKDFSIILWELSGSESYSDLRPLSYNSTDLFFLCFDISKPDTLQNIKTKWIPEISKHSPDTPFLLVGLKIDKRRNVKSLKEAITPQQSPTSSTPSDDSSSTTSSDRKKKRLSGILDKLKEDHQQQRELQVQTSNLSNSTNTLTPTITIGSHNKSRSMPAKEWKKLLKKHVNTDTSEDGPTEILIPSNSSGVSNSLSNPTSPSENFTISMHAITPREFYMNEDQENSPSPREQLLETEVISYARAKKFYEKLGSLCCGYIECSAKCTLDLKPIVNDGFKQYLDFRLKKRKSCLIM